MVAIGVLGPITADVDGVPAELGGPRQRAVLALLLTARGATLSADRMIDDLWRGEPPPSARASLQAYVSHLRRELEPGRSRRAPGRLLVSTPPGYALRPPDEAVDAWRFERALTRARGLLAADPARARTETAAALRLWHGEAYAEFADAPWAAVEAARLSGLRLTARETHAAATLHLGRPAEAVAEAEALTREEPLREEGWRLLVLALWADGRQADALAALRRVRRELTEELAIAPGPELTALEEAILNGRWEALRVGPFTPGGVRATSGGRTSAAPTPVRPSSAPPSSHGDLAPDAAAPHLPGPPPDAAAPFVGREAELAALGVAAGEAFAGAVRFVLVAGEAGAGKSRLLEPAARRLAAVAWVTAVGRCPEAEGAPPAWAWEEIAGRLARHAPPDPGLADDLAPLLDPGPRAEARRASDRFRLHRACRAWFAAATRARPLALFLDDLHRADRETLALLAGLAEDPPAGRLLIVAAHRPDEGDLAAVQAVLARRAPVRLPLDGLAPPDAVRLVRALAPVDAGTAAALAERTGGNPFFLQETARMFTGDAVTADALRAVPDGVRDVLRRRFDRLPPAALSVLRLAAAAGREADVEVLVRAATAGTAAGRVGSTPAGPAAPPAGDVPAGHVLAGSPADPAHPGGDAPAVPAAYPHGHAPAAHPAAEGPATAATPAVEDAVLDGLDAGLAAGLLTEPGPGRIRFAHALVRDTLYADTSGLRRARLHAALGRALRELRPDDVSAIAHHHLQAPATATARTAVDYAVRAADLAGRRYAHDTAAELLAQAAACVERPPAAFAGEDTPARLVALLGLQLQARARGGAVVEAQGVRARANAVAERHGPDDLLVEALTAWTEPTAWERRTYAHEDTRSAAALRRLLADGSLADAARCRLLEALAAVAPKHDPAGLYGAV
ncbi:BTAD domain-containing putative transcriptional regulator, partial [Streptomyces synnematoformans]|uniref:BTAD domain-containing putative transcriptional regulator n=1 Tax=Streptomyces synnematoformans TaxID=415721 RepID=UPI0031D0CF78